MRIHLRCYKAVKTSTWLPYIDNASPVASLHNGARAIALGQACGAHGAAGHEG